MDFWWALQTASRVSHFLTIQTPPFGSQGTWLWETIFTFGCFSLKLVYNSCTLQRLAQVAKFLFMYSFTHTNVVFLFRLLPSKIVIFISVCEKIKCFSSDNFSFFWGRFCWHPTYFFDFMWNSNKVFKDIKKEIELIFHQIKFIVFERVRLKKSLLSYGATFFFTQIYTA